MDYVYRFVKKTNKLIDSAIKIIILLLLVLATYGLWDNWVVAHKTVDYKNRADELAQLHKMNPDVVGWLVIDDTNIDYPLLIGQTNQDYLSADEYGNYSVSGSLFLDYRNDKEFTDFTTLIYGHNMTGGKMFSDLLKFEDETYFNTHTTGTLYTLEDEKSIEIKILLKTNAYDYTIFNPKHESKSARTDFLSYIHKKAIFQNNAEISIDDKLLVLSTCEMSVTNGRIVVIAKSNENKLQE